MNMSFIIKSMRKENYLWIQEKGKEKLGRKKRLDRHKDFTHLSLLNC